ncbi:MAG TPA: hypothetical protein VK530_15870 [Candidatus Acidoferrum sp.]|nr:hypothetical protein [Candidatus Acidoferrum sp.]
MKQLSLLAGALLVCGSLMAADADPKADVKAAAKKLAANYSWTSTPKIEGAGGGGGGGGNFRPGPTEGQLADGFVYQKSTFGERSFESLIKGEKAAIKGEDGWQNVDDLEGNRAGFGSRLKTFKAPAIEAADLADKAKALKKDGDVISGDLTEDAVKELLTFGRRPNADNPRPAPKEAKGTVKFWVKDGALAKYEYQVHGKVMGREDQEREVNRTTTVEIKEIGKTKLGAPEEGKKKVS